MRSTNLKGLLMRVVLLIVTLLLLTLPSLPASAAPEACAEVEAYVTRPVAHAGETVTSYVELHNCGDKTRRFNMQFTVTTACGEDVFIGDWSNSVLGGAAIYANASYGVPQNPCLGTYVLHVSAYSGNTLLDYYAAEFTVE